MNDGEVLDEIAAAKRALKSAETKATRKFSAAEKKASSFFGDSDVERAARHNAIKRAEAILGEELSRARVTYIDRLERLRRVAGDWADLVPRVR